jgi:protein-tyrosine phosphatase
VRWLGPERPFTEVLPGLYLGRRPTRAEVERDDAPRFLAVLDLTSEFTEAGPLRDLPGYSCIPLLDASAPSQAALRVGVEHIGRYLTEGPVLVHCAMGHGRSATFVGAFALATGKARSVEEAEALCRSARAGVRLHRGQRRALAAFLES